MSTNKKKPILTAHELRNLKKNELEEQRINYINRIILMVYCGVVDHAKRSDNHIFSKEMKSLCSEEFFRENKTDIIKGLQEMFPDAFIEAKVYGRLNNIMVDISKLEENVKKLIDVQFNQPYLVVNWSEEKFTVNTIC